MKLIQSLTLALEFLTTAILDPVGGSILPSRLPRAVQPSKIARENRIFPAISHQDAVKAVINNISLAQMKSYHEKLTSFHTRFYNSSTGVDASKWILKTITDIAAGDPYITVQSFPHAWEQPSVIAIVHGRVLAPVTIIGAHMDSVQRGNETDGRAPGADDNASGVVNLMEAFRALVKSGFVPDTPFEFHWYAKEETGRHGSFQVAHLYKNRGIQVRAYMNLDMTAYVKPGSTEVIALESTNTNNDLNEWMKTLGTTYTRLPVVINPPHNIGTSDNSRWNETGVPTTFPVEGLPQNINTLLHTANDTASQPGFSFEHSFEFAKLAAAFIYEMSA